MRRHAFVLAFIAALAAPTVAIAQQDQTRAPKTRAQPQDQLPVPLEQALYLIRSALLTLNDANRAGNYTVLRDLAAPSFQANNRSADLALSFADLRRRKFDMFAVALVAPKLSTPPYLDPDKRLRLTGHFPAQPLQINFDLTFENVANQWRLFAVTVGTPPAPAQNNATAKDPASSKKN